MLTRGICARLLLARLGALGIANGRRLLGLSMNRASVKKDLLMLFKRNLEQLIPQRHVISSVLANQPKIVLSLWFQRLLAFFSANHATKKDTPALTK